MFHARVHSTPCHVEENSSEGQEGLAGCRTGLLTSCAALTASCFLKRLEFICVVWICLRTACKQQISRLFTNSGQELLLGPLPFNDVMAGGTHGARLTEPVGNRQGPAGLWSHLQCLHLGGGQGDWQERKSSLKGDVEQLFSIFPEEK